jgi:hypothetical protein
MTYKKNFVCAIKVNGKILRESSDRVELPFGSEYTVLLKNLDSVRMQARISIDGKDAAGWLVIEPGRDVEVERFVEDLNRGNRFKFIERTARIEEHRGITAEDGLVRIEFKREKVYEAPKVVEHHTYHYHYPGGCYPRYPIYYSTYGNPSASGSLGSLTRSSGTASLNNSNFMLSAQNVSLCAANLQSAEQENDAGITVPGSISNQQFCRVSGFETDSSEVLVLHLVGKKAGSDIRVAKTVQTKVKCDTCGKKNKSSAKFCIECGTSLEKV